MKYEIYVNTNTGYSTYKMINEFHILTLYNDGLIFVSCNDNSTKFITNNKKLVSKFKRQVLFGIMAQELVGIIV